MSDMRAPLESSFLMPTGTSFALLVAPVALGLLVIWPLAGTGVRQQRG